MRARLLEFVSGLLAGVLTGVAAYFLATTLMARGWWMPILTGALPGLACGQISAVASRRRGFVLALFVLGLAIFMQWKLWNPPFEFDGTLTDYVRHLPESPPITLGVMVINATLAYYWGREQGIGFGRTQRHPDSPTRDGKTKAV